MTARVFVALLVIAISLAGCQTQDSSPGEQAVKYPADNLKNDTYRPGPGWQLVWADEFDGDELDPASWRRQLVEPGRFNDEWQRYTGSTENAFLDNGCLVIRALHPGNRHGMGAYTSARLHTLPEIGWRYGRIAARIQLPYGQGIWPAFWMLGANIDENGGDTPWPQSGEIDILELYGSRDNGEVEANLHYAGKSGRHANMGAVGYKIERGWFAENFHVFEIEWDEKQIQWFVDGQRYASTSIVGAEFEEFHKKFFILLNIAVGSKSAGRPDARTVFPQTMYVDWVRVYQKSPNPL